MNQFAFEHYNEEVDAREYQEQREEVLKMETLYKTEERFVDYLFDFEKEKAKNEAQILIDTMEVFIEKGYYPSLKYYLIGLVGAISKQMQKLRMPANKIFIFDATSVELIEEKFDDENAVNLLSEIIVFFIYKMKEKQPPNLLHQTVNEVIEYIDEEVMSPLSVEGIAKRFNVSTSHLSRIFREYSGITLVEYINIKKVEESQYYLRFSDYKISDISDNFRFCNQSYFTRIFKKYTGVTPRKFKNNIEGDYFKYHLQQEKVN